MSLGTLHCDLVLVSMKAYAVAPPKPLSFLDELCTGTIAFLFRNDL